MSGCDVDDRSMMQARILALESAVQFWKQEAKAQERRARELDAALRITRTPPHLAMENPYREGW